MNKTNTDIDIGTSNIARAPNINHNSPEVKDVCYFAERVRDMLGVKINHLRVAMDKSDNLLNSDMLTYAVIFNYHIRNTHIQVLIPALKTYH